MTGPRNRNIGCFWCLFRPGLWAFPLPESDPLLSAYSIGVDGELALSIPKAVLNEGEVARVSVGSSDPQDDCAHSHILKNGLLEREGEGNKGWREGEEEREGRVTPGAYALPRNSVMQ